MSEQQARRVLDAMFREQGLRIVNDYVMDNGQLVLDGYAPECGLGYEYVAAEEADLSSKPNQVLVIPALQTEDQLRNRATQWLREHRVAVLCQP